MRLKILLLLLLAVTIEVWAQEPYRSLMITEARRTHGYDNYVELTNMGDKPINLGEFKFARITPWMPVRIYDPWTDVWTPESYAWFWLPDVVLEPGESFTMTSGYDWRPEQYKKKVVGYEWARRVRQPEVEQMADLVLHAREDPDGVDPTDSITYNPEVFGPNLPADVFGDGGRCGYYIEHHVSETDSFVVDQVGGVFDNDGKNSSVFGYDVAGVQEATGNSILVRKFSVKQGNLDFESARGVGNDDSEWIVLPIETQVNRGLNRDAYWTIDNHGDYNLDENTLESDIAEIDYAGKKITVPWGTRRPDGIMHLMKKKPGIAWEYHMAPDKDSLSFNVQTGDQITIYVCGADLDKATFDIEVAEPAVDANMVVPVANKDDEDDWKLNVINNINPWPWVTTHDSGMDTITGTWYGIPYATRTDSLLERLVKPSNAAWDFVWVDGVERADLKHGDKLKVTAENGDVKEYFIEMQAYQPSHNANLSAITWPDIPDFYRGIFGWIGDTIPSFSPQAYNYRVQVPYDVEGIPALVPKTEQLNASIEVDRATNLTGTEDDRTVVYTVTAEDDSVQNVYSVELVQEKRPEDLQPYYGEPFVSELVMREGWSNTYWEIMNPGNQPLDLSNYMIAITWGANPAGAITQRSGNDYNTWLNRYNKYIPGYKWVDADEWAMTPGYVEVDLNVNSIVAPGDVFTFGKMNNDRWPSEVEDYWIPKQIDVLFNYNYEGRIQTWTNPWNEPLNGNPVDLGGTNTSWYMFKILNDSIKKGLKPATDPNDFELIETFGMEDGTGWVIGGYNKVAWQIERFIRKPEIYKGNPKPEGSFGTNWDDSEWLYNSWNDTWSKFPWPLSASIVSNDIGQHFINEPTHYKSTISSVEYKVSPGYSQSEKIRGVVTGTTVADFMGKIIKADENQSLKVMSNGDGSELATGDAISLNDVLVVMSADSSNTSKYIIEVSDAGLSSNAVLTSSLYTVEITDEPKSAGGESDDHIGTGVISGFEYGTLLRTVISNVEVPAGASMVVVDGNNNYVPLKMMNFDTTYVDVTVTPDYSFEVIAEDGVTTIVYELKPQASGSSAFLTSNVYDVDQVNQLIEFVPRGTEANVFLSNLIPSLGATLKLVDKNGLEREDGYIAQDDKVIVTSEDATVQTVYYLSMLPTEYILSTTYLAYVTSKRFSVDQLNMNISGLQPSLEIETFYHRIVPSTGATAVVVDEGGNEKLHGNFSDGDMLKVTSADGKVEVMYTLDFLTSTELSVKAKLLVYPNPTNDVVSVAGASMGSRIRVFSSNGLLVHDVDVQGDVETISLREHSSGIYLVIVTNNGELTGQYKVVRE